MGKKNYGKSVKTRLLNLMNETGYKYMYLLARYFNERLLYRVSVSQYKDNFLLKGGSLLYAMNGLEARPTVDVDFMADRISRDRDFLARVFQEILGIVCDEDGVSLTREVSNRTDHGRKEISWYKILFYRPYGYHSL